MSLFEDIEEFAEFHLPIVSEKGSRAVVMDPVSGASELEDYEVEILNTPLLQRLRQIHQMSFTQLVYVSGTHTRFEHTIGVATQSALLAKELRKKKPRLIDDIGIREVRLAALMHDTGHGIFSHSSEDYYKDYPEWEEVYESNSETRYGTPHEILSSLIVQSKAFRKFFQSLEMKYEIALDLDEVARCILGVSPKSNTFKAEVINGPFDADKSDYIVRDAFNTGIPLFFRPDILRHQIEVSWIGDRWQLSIPIGSIDSIEALIFSKIMLFSSVYSHHSLRSAECCFKAILDYCRDVGIRIGNRTLNKVIDFLWLYEHDLLSEVRTTHDHNLNRLIQRLVERKLLKRALLLSNTTVENPECLGRLSLFDMHKKREIAKEIWHRAGTPCLLQEIWLDAPSLPSFNTYDNVSVVLHDGNTVPFREVFPIREWADSFMRYKWRAHLFCPEDSLEQVALAGSRVLSEVGIDVTDRAFLFRTMPS